MLRSRKYQSARKQNSSGATGHLIGMSTTFTTTRPPTEGLQRGLEPHRGVEVVEGVDVVTPAGTGETLGLLGDQGRAGRHDEDVVGELGAVREMDGVRGDLDPVDRDSGRSRCPRCSWRARGRTMSSARAKPNGTNNRPGW